MSTRVLVGPKPDPAPSGGSSRNSDQELVHNRRRRHTPEHHQDRFLRIFARILMVMGALMMIWLLLRALGWV
jgi:hypothetical protein